MRIIETTVYNYDELSEDAKEKALESLWDINVSDSFWYEHIECELNEYGATLVEFYIDRNNTCKIDIDDAFYFAHQILKNHGQSCETYKTAWNYLEKKQDIKDQAEVDEDGFVIDEWAFEQDLESLDCEFAKEIEEDYLKILKDNYEYYTSREAIEEAIEASRYEFTEDGKLA